MSGLILTKRQQKKADFARIGTITADKLLSTWQKGGRCFGLTAGRFSLISLIESILKRTGSADVCISTWSAGFYDTHAIDSLMTSGLITDMRWVLDRSFSSRKSAYAVTLEQLFPPEKIRTTDTHAKFVLISNDDWWVTIRTSMNLNENKKCETFEIDDDKDIFDFYNAYVKDLFDVQPAGIIQTSTICRPNVQTLFGVEETENSKQDKWNFAW